MQETELTTPLNHLRKVVKEQNLQNQVLFFYTSWLSQDLDQLQRKLRILLPGLDGVSEAVLASSRLMKTA